MSVKSERIEIRVDVEMKDWVKKEGLSYADVWKVGYEYLQRNSMKVRQLRKLKEEPHKVVVKEE